MKNITAQQLHERMQLGEEVNLLDVREPNERTEFNIGGYHIPLGQVQTYMLDDIEHLKDKEIVVYCRSGKRSQMAAMALEQAGFTQVTNLSGGMLEWQEKIKQQ